jgi:hypothetical protein
LEEDPLIRILLAGFAFLFSTLALGEMYKWTDKQGKVQYSDQPPPADATQQAAPKVPTGGSSAPAAASGKFRPEEEVALGALCAIAFTEFGCMLELKRLCSLEEMVKGGPGGKPQGFEKDPNSDPNYQYAVNIRGGDITMSATPRRPGLSGFFNNGEATFYSASGPASANDKRVKEGVNCKGFSKG